MDTQSEANVVIEPRLDIAEFGFSELGIECSNRRRLVSVVPLFRTVAAIKSLYVECRKLGESDGPRIEAIDLNGGIAEVKEHNESLQYGALPTDAYALASSLYRFA